MKTPKLHFLDSGLLAAMVAATEGGSLLHYRDEDQDEVDIVVEAADGAVIGIEVKATATVRAGDLKGLRKLASILESDFRLGVVL